MKSDFLSNLLDRALERAPVLQRRRRSLFEPVPDSGGVGTVSGGKAAEHREEAPVSARESLGIEDASVLRPTMPTRRRATAAGPAMAMPENTDLDAVHFSATIQSTVPAAGETKRRAGPPPTPSVEQATPILATVAMPERVATIVEKAVEKPELAVRPTRPSAQSNRVETMAEKVVEKPWTAVPSAALSTAGTELSKVVPPSYPLPVQPTGVSTIEQNLTGETSPPRDAPQPFEIQATPVKSTPPVEPATPTSVRMVLPPPIVATIVQKAVDKAEPASRFPLSLEANKGVEAIVVRKLEKSELATPCGRPAADTTVAPAVMLTPSSPAVRLPIVPTIQQNPPETRTPRDASQQREANTALITPRQPAAPPRLLPLSAPLSWVQARSVLVRESTPPAPTIQVTIGRLEVRATSPSPAAPKKVPSKPAAMSLEEYLKQRNEGRR